MTAGTYEITWFGLLAERRGVTCESLRAEHLTAASLYTRLAELHALRVPASSVLVAINDELVPATTILRSGDRIAFMPPMSGG